MCNGICDYEGVEGKCRKPFGELCPASREWDTDLSDPEEEDIEEKEN